LLRGTPSHGIIGRMSREKELQLIAKKYNLKFIVLFGSKARGQVQNKESDLDIAVFSNKKPDYELFRDLFSDLSDVFSKENVDLRFLNDADLLFRFNVVKDGKLLYGDKDAYQAYTLSTIRMYTDDLKKFAPFQDRLLELNQKRLEEALC